MGKIRRIIYLFLYRQYQKVKSLIIYVIEEESQIKLDIDAYEKNQLYKCENKNRIKS